MVSRVWRLDLSRGRDGFRSCQETLPAPGPGQILIGVKAVSLNFRDLLIAEGRYADGGTADIVPGSDAAGEVIAVGAGVTRFAPGDRVCPGFSSTWVSGAPTANDLRSTLGSPIIDGVLRDHLVCNAETTVEIPSHLSFEEAACLPCAGVTAWNALHGPRPVRAGETVLTLGLGGVSCFAIQLARLAGARVLSTSSTQARLEIALSLGAHHAINYVDQPDWDRVVMDLTDGKGVDHVIEVGGGGTLERSIASTAVNGQIHMIGVLTDGTVNPRLLIGWRTLRGVTVGSAADFREMNRAVEIHSLRPRIDRVFSFDQVPDAYRYLKGASHVGKVVVSL